MKKKVNLVVIELMIMLVGCTNQIEKQADNLNHLETYDNYNREVTIDTIPERVLTLGPNNTELFVSLGLEDRIIGSTLNDHMYNPYPDIAEKYNQIPELNHSSATREAVLSSGADFIYGIDWEFGQEGLQINELNEYGINVYVNQANSLEEFYQEVEDIGSIFEINETTDLLINELKNRIKTIEQKSAGVTPVNVLIYDSGGEGVFTATQANFETELINLAGGENVFSDIKDKEWTTVSYEEVIKRDPDFIVVHEYGVFSGEDKIKEIKANSILNNLTAVQEERFIILDLVDIMPGIRNADTVETFYNSFFNK